MVLHKFLLLVTFIGLCSCSPKSSVEISKTTNENTYVNPGRIKVVIGVADACQQPLTFEDGRGLSKDIVQELNDIQNKYEFTHEFLPTKRLEMLAADGKIHLAAFSNLNWGWDKSKVQRSTEVISDKDVFFTLKKPGRDVTFFDDINIRSKVGVQGFHYNFIESNPAVQELADKISFTGVQSEKAVVDMILLERGEVGVVSILTLQYLLISDPEKYSKLFVSQKYDSEYERYFVLMEESPISEEELNSLLSLLKKSGRLDKLLVKYGLADPVLAGK